MGRIAAVIALCCLVVACARAPKRDLYRHGVSDAQMRQEVAECVLYARQFVAGRTVTTPTIQGGGGSAAMGVASAGAAVSTLGQSIQIERDYQTTLHLCLEAKGWVWETVGK